MMFKSKKYERALKGAGGARSLTLGQLFSFIYHLPNFAKLYWSLLWDKRAPLFPKIMLALAIVYFFSPLDLVPDFMLPGIGYADDLVILVLAFRYFIKAMPNELVAEKVKAIDTKAKL